VIVRTIFIVDMILELLFEITHASSDYSVEFLVLVSCEGALQSKRHSIKPHGRVKLRLSTGNLLL